ncbi:hypothetical protein B0A55_10631 [Friedmanniomyces simplex]|uniref:Uncharacterized protein n=1 Tax=Friedmanniomyces simplex TaxID=329884 RepID=A0A4U0WPT2_9PEZI|nr:hypothetical protein B0A55_10631 [Friedmanniomyces simplex]
MATSAEQLCEELPEEFAQYVQEVKDIPDGVRPHYEKLRQKFRRLAVREGVRTRMSGIMARRGGYSNPSNKRSPAVFMLVGKQERAFDDDVARAIRYKDVELKLVRNNIPATVAVTPAKFAMKVSLRHWKGDLHSRSRE